jgi:hypothetical protein
MSCNERNITLRYGETGVINFTVVDDVGAIFNLTGYSVTLVVSGNQARTTFAATITDAVNGIGYFVINKSDYANLRIGDFKFAVWVHNGDGPSDQNRIAMTGELFVVNVPQRI